VQYRTLGSTNLRVSAIGFGGWGIGGRTVGETSYGDVDDRVSAAALDAAFASGITFFDTAPAYGNGHSEHMIGSVFADRRDQIVLATKAGQEHWGQGPDFAAESMLCSIERSLKRLNTDYIDLLQLHNVPIPYFRSNPEIASALDQLKEDGTLRAWGLSVKSPDDALLVLEDFDIETIQLNFNMLDTRAELGGFFALARSRNIGVIARTPLCFGFLSGAIDSDTVFPAGDHRNSWTTEQRAKWLEGTAKVMAAVDNRSPGESHSETALRFCLTPEVVSVVLPGILTPEEAVMNARVGHLPPLSIQSYERVLEINRSTDFFVPRPRPETHKAGDA